MPNLVNALPALSVRLVQPWTGVWFADVDVELGPVDASPSGRVSLTIGTTVCVGTVDPRASGVFAGKCQLRIVGGGGGWDKAPSALGFHNDGGVLSSAVYSSTAASVGESVVDLLPSRLGNDFLRSSDGPASLVFGSREDWYVTLQGITVVGPRATIPPDPLAEILSYDPMTRTAQVASDAPIVPGSLLVDARLGAAPLVVRDVEQVWDGGGARATVWCGTAPGTRLQSALAALVEQRAGVVYLRTYRYRVVSTAPDLRVVLQAVSPVAGMPDALPIATWFGMPGLSGVLQPGSIVLVEFTEGDPGRPVIRAFEGDATPLALNVDVATVFSINSGLRPVAALGDFAGPFPIAATGFNLMVP